MGLHARQHEVHRQGHGGIQGPVALTDPGQSPDQQRDSDHHGPRAFIELADHNHQQHYEGGDSPKGIHQQPSVPAIAMALPPALHQAQLREGEGGEHPKGIEVHRHGGVATADEDDQGRHAQQHANPVLVNKAISHPAHLPGEALVIGKHRRQPREPREGGVGRQHQDQQGGDLHRPQQHAVGAKHPCADLGNHGEIAARGHPIHETQAADGKKHPRQQDPHHQQRFAGIAGRWLLEHLNAIGDGLDASHRRAARAKGAQDQKQPQWLNGVHQRRWIRNKAMAEGEVLQTRQRQHHHHHHKGVGGNGKHTPSFFKPAQIGPAHQGQQQQRKRHLVLPQLRQQRADGLGPRHQADGSGQRVVDQQGRCSNQADVAAEVFAHHHIGAAAIGIGRDRLAVGEHHDRDQGDDRHGDRHRKPEGCTASQHQHAQGGFRCVGHRGEGIGGQDRQGLDVGQTLISSGIARQGPPQQPLPKRHPTAAITPSE